MSGTFRKDLSQEQKLGKFLDIYYQQHKLFEKNYSFKRVSDDKNQFLGIDAIIYDKNTGEEVSYIDEKSQLDYINHSLPTFAFEISYLKGLNSWKEGWLFDEKKTTTQYFLVTSIQADENKEFTGCRVICVDRFALIDFLEKKGLTKEKVFEIEKDIRENKGNGKISTELLSEKKEGYFFFSKDNKAEAPINLVLKLSFLLENKIGRELIKS